MGSGRTTAFPATCVGISNGFFVPSTGGGVSASPIDHCGVSHPGSAAGRVLVHAGWGDECMVSVVPQVAAEPNEGTCKGGDRQASAPSHTGI